jgi:hypothetical protein
MQERDVSVAARVGGAFRPVLLKAFARDFSIGAEYTTRLEMCKRGKNAARKSPSESM